MRTILLLVFLVGCDDQDKAAAPRDAGADVGASNQDAGTRDAGPSYFTATMVYDYPTQDLCFHDQTLAHCTKTQLVAEVFRSQLVSDYPDCAFSGGPQYVSVDCAGKCVRRCSIPSCNGGYICEWDCPALKWAFGWECYWDYP